MYVNNETGVIQPIEEIGEILQEHQALFHTDAVQAIGLLPINVEQLQVDLLSASAHKINGPKGSAFMYVKEGIHLQPQFYVENKNEKCERVQKMFRKLSDLKNVFHFYKRKRINNMIHIHV